jgi:hypothetical protein
MRPYKFYLILKHYLGKFIVQETAVYYFIWKR